MTSLSFPCLVLWFAPEEGVPFHEAGPESVAVLGRRAHLDADEVGRVPVASRRRAETQLLGFLRERTH
jgi:hypothetical protein